MKTLLKLVVAIMSAALPIAALFGTEQIALRPTFGCLAVSITASVINFLLLYLTRNKKGSGSLYVAFIILAIGLIIAAELSGTRVF